MERMPILKPHRSLISALEGCYTTSRRRACRTDPESSQTMVIETKFVNGTNFVLQLKLGSNGVYQTICTLSPQSRDGRSQKHEHVMKVDPNSTYTEYWLGTGNRGESVILGADICIDSKVIMIVKDGDKFTFIPTPRHGPQPVKVGVHTNSEVNPDLHTESPSSSSPSSRHSTHHWRGFPGWHSK